MMSAFWTDERVERLKLLKRNKWSSGMIARALGCTRNAVIGKLDRLRPGPRSPRAPIDWNMRKAVILDVQMNKLPAHVAGLRLGLSADQTRRIATRLGIPFAPHQGAVRGQRAIVRLPRPPKDRPSIKGVRQAPLPRVAAPVPESTITFMDLRDGVTDLRGNYTPGTCKYELTDSDHPRDFRFCGHDTVQGTPWCPAHYITAHQSTSYVGVTVAT